MTTYLDHLMLVEFVHKDLISLQSIIKKFAVVRMDVAGIDVY